MIPVKPRTTKRYGPKQAVILLRDKEVSISCHFKFHSKGDNENGNHHDYFDDDDLIDR